MNLCILPIGCQVAQVYGVCLVDTSICIKIKHTVTFGAEYITDACENLSELSRLLCQGFPTPTCACCVSYVKKTFPNPCFSGVFP